MKALLTILLITACIGCSPQGNPTTYDKRQDAKIDLSTNRNGAQDIQYTKDAQTLSVNTKELYKRTDSSNAQIKRLGTTDATLQIQNANLVRQLSIATLKTDSLLTAIKSYGARVDLGQFTITGGVIRLTEYTTMINQIKELLARVAVLEAKKP